MTGKDIEKLYKDAIEKRRAEARRVARLIDKEKISLFEFYEKRLERAVKDGFLVKEDSNVKHTSWYANDFIRVYVNKDGVSIIANIHNKVYRNCDAELFRLFHRYVAISTFLKRTKNYEDPGFYDNVDKLRHYLED